MCHRSVAIFWLGSESAVAQALVAARRLSRCCMPAERPGAIEVPRDLYIVSSRLQASTAGGTRTVSLPGPKDWEAVGPVSRETAHSVDLAPFPGRQMGPAPGKLHPTIDILRWASCAASRCRGLLTWLADRESCSQRRARRRSP